MKTHQKLPYNYEKKYTTEKSNTNPNASGSRLGWLKYTQQLHWKRQQHVVKRALFIGTAWNDDKETNFAQHKRRDSKKSSTVFVPSRVYFHFRSFMKLCFIRWSLVTWSPDLFGSLDSLIHFNIPAYLEPLITPHRWAQIPSGESRSLNLFKRQVKKS